MLATAGCADFQGSVSPDAQRESRPDSDEPPLIVREDDGARHASDAPETPDTFGELILEYIQRIDKAESDRTRSATAKESASSKSIEPARRPPAQLVFDPSEPAVDTQQNTAGTRPSRTESTVIKAPSAVVDGPPRTESTLQTEPGPAETAFEENPASSAPAAAPAATQVVALPLRVRPAGATAIGPVSDENVESATVNGALRARGGTRSLCDFLDQLPPLTEDAHASFVEHLDRRILLVLAGEYESAREPLPMASREQAEIASRFVESLIPIREGHLGDPIGASTAALREIDRLADALRQISELSIGALEICREVRAFGQYTPLVPAEFRTGVASEFVLYCEVRDFTTRQLDDGQFEARFEMTTTIFDHAGGEVLKFEDRDLVDRCRARRRDCFIPRLIRLPATLSPGGYVAKVTVVDKLGDKVVERQAEFRVTAR